ncbi:hypothetical protein OPV22_032649 [Ensete ventricosum]|uniref:Malectin-like domain-containing protein n=1 Tax=Ensete ventricosum TaxID=4639 RepID=A0AAV8PYW0_ENSVE|nr:hypothetical protein OPV22_032649 [Ensete ventricosum]
MASARANAVKDVGFKGRDPNPTAYVTTGGSARQVPLVLNRVISPDPKHRLTYYYIIRQRGFPLWIRPETGNRFSTQNARRDWDTWSPSQGQNLFLVSGETDMAPRLRHPRLGLCRKPSPWSWIQACYVASVNTTSEQPPV